MSKWRAEPRIFPTLRNWSSYYWREDFTFLLRDDKGQLHRVISREPTPWTNLRLGTTYTGLKVDWQSKPRVKVIGVQAIDRQPANYYDLKLDPDKDRSRLSFCASSKTTSGRIITSITGSTIGARKRAEKMVPHYANDSPHYAVYGYLNGIAAPFDKEGQELVKKYEGEYSGIIYHGRVKKANNDVGYEVQIVNLMGRHKKTLDYNVFYGKPGLIPVLDGKK